MHKDVKFEYFSEVSEVSVDWLWYPYIPYGKLTVLQGDPGEGKSTFILNIAALLSNGKAMPDGFVIKEPHNIIYQCSEDGVSDTVKPRLIAAGADCNRVAYIVDDDAPLTFDDERIDEAIEKTAARLLILDPLQSYIPQDGDMHNAARMRSILSKLAKVAAKRNCAIVLVGHMNKAGGGKKLYRGLGSIDIAAIARSVLMVSRDECDESIRYVCQIKSSLAPEGSAIGFQFDPISGFRWLGPCTPNTRNTVEDGPSETKRSIAARYIYETLSEQDTPVVEIMEMLQRLGISARTINSAKKDIEVKSYRKNDIWYWRLPSVEEAEEME